MERKNQVKYKERISTRNKGPKLAYLSPLLGGNGTGGVKVVPS